MTNKKYNYMSEIQKNIIERLLKEKQKTKRELAKFLTINESSINRTIKNPDISNSKLKKVAEFLAMDFMDLFQMINSLSLQENPGEYQLVDKAKKESPLTLTELRALVRKQEKTIETMAEMGRQIVETSKI
jgi:plasmid maintenance system antidote protein VapI